MKPQGFFSILSIFLAVFVSGCALAVRNPTPEEAKNADYGPPPENPKEQALAWLKDYLKDPMSAVVEWQGECEEGWWKWSPDLTNPLFIPKIHYGWKLVAKVNAKNSMGAYTGFTTYTFCFEGGKILHVFK